MSAAVVRRWRVRVAIPSASLYIITWEGAEDFVTHANGAATFLHDGREVCISGTWIAEQEKP